MKKPSFIISLYLIWLFVLVFIPFILMIILAFSTSNGLDLSTLKFSLVNIEQLFSNVYFEAYKNSIVLSFCATASCLLIGYPVALILTNMKNAKLRSALLAMLILPMWSNMLLRIMGWEILFNPKSILNAFGISLNLIGNPLAIIIGMISIYLPLMIFPIYTSLSKIDDDLINASYDLGADRKSTLLKVILPLSLPGIYSGITMTFLPSATNFALPERLSGGNITLLGNIINTNFGKTFNYNFGSLLSLILIVIIFASMIFINKKDKDGDLLV